MDLIFGRVITSNFCWCCHRKGSSEGEAGGKQGLPGQQGLEACGLWHREEGLSSPADPQLQNGFRAQAAEEGWAVCPETHQSWPSPRTPRSTGDSGRHTQPRPAKGHCDDWGTGESDPQPLLRGTAFWPRLCTEQESFGLLKATWITTIPQSSLVLSPKMSNSVCTDSPRAGWSLDREGLQQEHRYTRGKAGCCLSLQNQFRECLQHSDAPVTSGEYTWHP